MLDPEVKKRYKEKLSFDSEELPDPYAVPDETEMGRWHYQVAEHRVWRYLLFFSFFSWLLIIIIIIIYLICQ